VLEPQRQVVVMHAEADPAGGQFGRRAVEQHRALEHDDAIEVAGDRTEFMTHEEHGCAVMGHEVDDRIAELLLGLLVDSGDRLVQHQQVGFTRERLGDHHALLLTTGQLGHGPVAQVAQRDGLQRVVHRIAIGASAQAPPSSAREPPHLHDLFDGRGQVSGQSRPLRHVADPPALSQGARFGAQHFDAAGLRAQ
jgi:hypothetical protein